MESSTNSIIIIYDDSLAAPAKQVDEIIYILNTMILQFSSDDH